MKVNIHRGVFPKITMDGKQYSKRKKKGKKKKGGKENEEGGANLGGKRGYEINDGQ